MSDEQLLAGFEACARRLVEERGRSHHIPIHVAIACPEGEGATIFHDDLFSPLLGHFDYTQRLSTSTSPAGSHLIAYYTPRDRGFIPTDRVNSVIGQVEVITEELVPLCRRLPPRVQEMLRLTKGTDWWRILFHLAWHFERPFLTSYRERLLTSDGSLGMRADETCIQFDGCRSMHDLHPGMIFGVLKHDALTASEAAIGIILDAIRRTQTAVSLERNGNTSRTFPSLHERFRQAGLVADSLPSGRETTVKLLRFTDSFTSPPATEWANLELGGQVESMYRLARINSDQEFCHIRGGAKRQVTEWSAEAGNALPSWCADSATLFDEDRRLENGFITRILAPAPILSSGPTERWLRFVFATLKRLRPNQLEIRWGSAAGAHSYGMATLKQNFYASSALAIKLAGLPSALRTVRSGKPQDRRKPTPQSKSKPGRPPNPVKREIVKYVGKLRANSTQWKVIPDAVFKKFGIRYTSETLRGYHKSG